MRGNGCRILLVEDEADSREALAELLEVKGFEVATAEDGGVALRHLESGFDPDVILTDLMMPTVSGWQLHDKLKQRLRWDSIPLVILCGMSEAERGTMTVDAAFQKPIDALALVTFVSELCGL
jgi:CheY-like chemotaxis protein